MFESTHLVQQTLVIFKQADRLIYELDLILNLLCYIF